MAAAAVDPVAAGRGLRAHPTLFALLATVAGCAGRDAPAMQVPQSRGVALETVVTGLHDPLHLTAPRGDTRLFIVEQAGRIRLVKDGRLLARPWLDIEARVGSGGERGLLSLAFHPGFRENGRFFVNYTDRRGDTRVSEFHADPSADTAEAASERQWLNVSQPYANHNGGHVLFGPDGRLYIGMGDGGSGGDPHRNAQNPRSQLGKLLRIDVDRQSAIGNRESAVEVWALGLRNPWRVAFDSGRIYIADVGQGDYEEVDVAPASAAGLNYGWRTMEGTHCFGNPLCSNSGLVMPALEYDHTQGCSIIGGVVYRGRAVPALTGHYLYSDYCEGWLRSFKYVGGQATELRRWRIPGIGAVLSFGEDGMGEVYVLSAGGGVYRLKAES